VSKANPVVLVWVFRLWLWPLSLFASLLLLVGETQIWPGDLRVVVSGGVFFSFVS